MAKLSLLVFLLIGVLILVNPSTASKFCKCLPSQSCWPTPKTWGAFNSSVRGALISVKPAASPCHDPDYNEAACANIKQQWSNVWWRADQPGAVQSPHLEMDGSQGCLIGTNRSAACLQGSLPVYAVAVTDPSQVRSAIQFADRYNLRVVVKNTGHEFTGRNTAAGSLSIWMHNLKGITFTDDFKPAGSYSPSWWWSRKQTAVKVGAGVQWEDLYEAAFKNGKTVIGAQCVSVGAAGGYPLGGGHSQMSPTFGLAADNVLEFELVTPQGKLIQVNSQCNRDLFWALRGGGGGTYGVVLSVTYATFPALRSLAFASYTFSSKNADNYRSFLNRFIHMSTWFSSSGWGGLFLLSHNSVSVQYLLPNGNLQFAKGSFQPLLSYASSLGINATGEILNYNSYYEWHRAVQCQGGRCGFPSGFSLAETSRLVPWNAVLYRSSEIAGELTKFVEAGYVRVSVYLVGGGKVSSPQPNSVLPAWRDALLHVLVAGLVPEDTDVGARRTATLKATSDMNRLRELTPGSGAYLNEADYYEPNWQQSFYGRNYQGLKYIKNKVDPKGLFVCRHCVGSEDWSEDLNCRM